MSECELSGHGWHWTHNVLNYPTFVCVYCGTSPVEGVSFRHGEPVEEGFIEERRRQVRYLRSLRERAPHGKAAVWTRYDELAAERRRAQRAQRECRSCGELIGDGYCYLCNGGIRRRS